MPDEAPKRLIVVGDRVLIAPEEGEERTNVGLYLPATALEGRQVQGGRIIATGPGTPMTEPASMDDEPWKIHGPDVKYLPMQAGVRVPRDNLEVRKDRPKSWSVVHEPHLVCPGCHKRRHVSGQPKDVKCHECGNTFSVDWTDRG